VTGDQSKTKTSKTKISKTKIYENWVHLPKAKFSLTNMKEKLVEYGKP